MLRLVSFDDGFSNKTSSAVGERIGALLSVRSRTQRGNMYFTFRLKKNILSAAILAGLLFVANISARATDQARIAGVGRPNGTAPLRMDIPPMEARIGRIEIPAVGLATRVLEGDVVAEAASQEKNQVVLYPLAR